MKADEEVKTKKREKKKKGKKKKKILTNGTKSPLASTLISDDAELMARPGAFDDLEEQEKKK